VSSRVRSRSLSSGSLAAGDWLDEKVLDSHDDPAGGVGASSSGTARG